MKKLVFIIMVAVLSAKAKASELFCRDMAIFRTIEHLNKQHVDPNTKSMYDLTFGEILSSEVKQDKFGNNIEVYKIRVQNDHPDSPAAYIVELENFPYFCNLFKIEEVDLY